ncbi:FkbM family methyltransferase [Gramella sp. Hel_I_59]|uniref:FkbM family methyltransferase n=1 Tax=Gramella sp. Hel_I_59 TaxID=1249978 RepID=UPI0011545D4B|nr:FkbM family methyltransferase [Gramella sp. Hel_I_59]
MMSLSFQKYFDKVFLRNKLPINSIPFWINKCLDRKCRNIIQIGSNDGSKGDPLHKLILKRKKWEVLFVEPVPYLFDRLIKNYPNENRFSFEKLAINEGKTETFYYVDSKAKEDITDLPFWYDQLGSFNRSNIVNHLEGRLEPYIKEIEIKGTSLEELFKKNNIEKLDLLHIDTEGYDWKILKQLDIGKYHPTIILFEHKHLSEAENIDSVKFVDTRYHILKFASDYLCIKKEVMQQKDMEFVNNLI